MFEAESFGKWNLISKISDRDRCEQIWKDINQEILKHDQQDVLFHPFQV